MVTIPAITTSPNGPTVSAVGGALSLRGGYRFEGGLGVSLAGGLTALSLEVDGRSTRAGTFPSNLLLGVSFEPWRDRQLDAAFSFEVGAPLALYPGGIDDNRLYGEEVEDDDDRDDTEHDCLHGDDPVLAHAIRGQLATAICTAIAALPARQRRVLELALADHTDREIANKLGVSVQAVNKARLAGIVNVRRVVLARYSYN